MLLGASKTKLLAKIENSNSMEIYESILKMTDGIVIDRGYLAAEVELDIVPVAQKKMIAMVRKLIIHFDCVYLGQCCRQTYFNS